jgi:DNA-directed RNA polymerase specialized sigma24 family protein
MSLQHSITPQMDREQLILALLEDVTPYLRQAARSGKLDFEELYQDASIKIMQILDHYRDQVRHLQAYVAVTMRHLVAYKVKYAEKRRAVSLDEPLSDDVSLTLADLLPDAYTVEPVTVVLARERLDELQVRVSAAKHYQTRRMLGEMHATALAVVSVERQLVQAGS